ncbi:PAS domain-containing hybrid sensor histidine kinase/response regulator [Brevundimonas sp.]|uniref:PAS domain-containing hybrid sensor histidine kinase/response regulator n=1 Tax=Brevundimonas sp. TaxID=1871086 RepID=UPI0025E531F2|nr:PAS domain-containing hybrid sensor histidine kinase/response regulator [Brevundimonas sp.]
MTYSGSDEELLDLFEHAPCGYVATDASGRMTAVNATLGKWLGQGPSELLGRKFQDLLNIAGKIYFETHFAPLLRMQGFFNEVALDLVAADGSKTPVLVNAVERRRADGSAAGMRIAVFNASDRRLYESQLLDARRRADTLAEDLRVLNVNLEARVADEVAERMKAEAALRQAQKMDAIGQLTGGVAHDFNNLLTVIMGGLDGIRKHVALLEPSAPAQRIERSAALSMQGAQKAATLTKRLLAFARRQPLDPKPIDTGKLVTSLADLLQRTLGETVSLETVSGAGLWLTLADPDELENALVNLAINARDAMQGQGGGRLTIETSNAFLDHDYVESITEPVSAGQYVLIAVSDTGCGVPEDVLAQVFEPFFTTKAVGKGTGLGLSQVYGFVRQSSGHVKIYSEPGVGTTVNIYLPRLSGAEAADVPERGSDATVVHGGTETILVVEDHEELRAFSVATLAELGYRVLSAGSGSEAIELLRREQIDLLFTDVVLPEGMNGRRVADAAINLQPHLKVLFTTGYTANAIVHNGRLDAGVELLSKPFAASALGARVRQILDQ